MKRFYYEHEHCSVIGGVYVIYDREVGSSEPQAFTRDMSVATAIVDALNDQEE